MEKENKEMEGTQGKCEWCGEKSDKSEILCKECEEVAHKITEYLSTRLGVTLYMNTINSTSLEYEEIPLQHIGICKHMIKQITIDVRVWTNNENKDLTFVPAFCYKHCTGGSNGHDMDFRVKYSRIGKKFTEVD